jgi:hypothetical protein
MRPPQRGLVQVGFQEVIDSSWITGKPEVMPPISRQTPYLD